MAGQTPNRPRGRSTGRTNPGDRTGRPSSSARRGPSRRSNAPRTPPAFLAAMILVPTVAIGGLLIYKNSRRAPEPVVVEQADPNSNIDALQLRFRELRTESYQVFQKLRTDDRESKKTAETLKLRLEDWLREFDEATSDLKNSKGEWPAEYRRYSKVRADASLLRMDLIKTGNL